MAGCTLKNLSLILKSYQFSKGKKGVKAAGKLI